MRRDADGSHYRVSFPDAENVAILSSSDYTEFLEYLNSSKFHTASSSDNLWHANLIF